MKKKRMLLLVAMFVFTFAFIRFNTVDVQVSQQVYDLCEPQNKSC